RCQERSFTDFLQIESNGIADADAIIEVEAILRVAGAAMKQRGAGGGQGCISFEETEVIVQGRIVEVS
ncbi:MAG: hypothetical protein NZL87_10075, partial [Thermomicrobium sp.]|nr:hypothetical protein [Thermomicrobium sp.]